ncbi:MAG: chorismate mutase [Fodinibius sp.]|nr:chorismate mutase [Fodinibius sp.]
MADKLDSIREILDQTDKKIVDALAKRQELVREISSLKLDEDRNIRDSDREEQLLNKITKLAHEAGLDRYFAEQLFKDIIQHSRAISTE